MENYFTFVPGVSFPEDCTSNDLWFIFNDNKLMIKRINDKIIIPLAKDIGILRKQFKHVHYIGSFMGTHCFAAVLEELEPAEGEFLFEDLRAIMGEIDEEIFFVGSRAIQVINWDKDHKYCGRCGSLMEKLERERAKKCPKCGFVNYPRISPAIIVAVTKGEKLLMAHNTNFSPGVYSVIAGFVDPGETFEECVKREVMEEVGIKVKNIKYFKSQPWPFPNSLMVAFTAEYADGEIVPDGIEIEDAGWYSINDMPFIPNKGTIARKLIDLFIQK